MVACGEDTASRTPSVIGEAAAALRNKNVERFTAAS